MSANGVYVNNKRIRGSFGLAFGDCINILELKLLFLGQVLGVCGTLPYQIANGALTPYIIPENTLVAYGKRSTLTKRYFHRAPRTILKIEKGHIAIDNAPVAGQQEILQGQVLKLGQVELVVDHLG